MSTMTTTAMEHPGLASPDATALPPETDEVEYPEGNWIAQSVAHGDAVRKATTALHHHFRERQQVLVAMELMVYYQRDNNEAKLQPDVQVVFGVRRGDRSSFKVWEEGKAPDFVLEVASPSTEGNDAEHKAWEYARIGVREYWRLDPQGSLMENALEGYELSAGQYEPLQPVVVAGRGGALRSRVLGLELRSQRQAGATVLVFVDPRTGQEFDGTLEAAERRIAEREEQALILVRAAEQRVSAAERDKRAAERDKQAAEQRANAEAERARALEQRLQALTAHAPPPEGHP
ncbi:MAG: Uma2 family endonuclease [Bryobacterales bacterium]|nr:Uma2 family endonuclease [Bryobacterales bacterium]